MAAATPHSDETQLKELLNQEASLTAPIELTVAHVAMISYSYKLSGRSESVQTRQLQTVLRSRIGEQYCSGVANLRKKDVAELEALQCRFQEDTVWKFSRIKLLDERVPFIHPTCRIIIDLRKSVAQPMLQSKSFPRAPVPTCTIAKMLELPQMQCFDLMVSPVKVLDSRRTGADFYPAPATDMLQSRSQPRTNGARADEMPTHSKE